MHSVAEKPVPASYTSCLPLDGPNLTPPCNEIQPAGPIGRGERSNVVNVHLNLDIIDDGYEPFINDLVKELTYHPQHTANKDEYDWITDKNPLLPEQMDEEPARWIYVHLRANDNNNETKTTTLAIRDDTVYLVGFWSEKTKKWYELGKTGQNVPFITGSAFLGCDVTYGSLLDGNGKNGLIHVKLGKDYAAEAVCKLSSYDREGVVDAKTKMHLARLIVMICEAARMFPLHRTVQNGWSDRTTTIDGKQVKYVDNWRKLSKAVMGWGKYPEVLKKFGVKNQDSALGVVRLLLNSPSKGSGGGTGGGRGGGDGGGRGHGGGDDDPPRENEEQNKQPQEEKHPQKQKAKQMQPREEEPSPKPGGGGHGRGRNKRPHGDPKQKQQDEEEPPLTPAEQGPSQQQDEQEPPPMPVEQRPPHPQQGLFCEEEEDDDEEDDDDDDDDDDDCAGPGQFLLEVLAVHADIRVVGTIAVFDGKRGQIIYSDDGQGDAPNKDSQDNLLLTGPYKAISAGGRVSVKFTDQSSNVGRATLWDAYNDSDGDTYDTVLTKDITLGGVTITVTYAVLSNAVEANMQVELKLNGGTTARVHGEIMAQVPYLGGKSVLLFSGPEQEPEALTSSDVLTIPVPLARSVVVAPLLDSPFKIKVKLDAACPSLSFDNEFTFFPLQRDNTKEIEGLGVVVRVKITAPDICARPKEDTPPSCVYVLDEEVDTVPQDVYVLPEEVDSGTPDVNVSPKEVGAGTPDVNVLREEVGTGTPDDFKVLPEEVNAATPDINVPSQGIDKMMPTKGPFPGIYVARAPTTNRRPNLHRMAGQEGKDGPSVVVVPLKLDMDAGDYAKCIEELREKLTGDRQHDPRIAKHHYWPKNHLLPFQQPKQPARWIHIKLMARSGRNTEPRHITLVIRDDNVYLVGFMNHEDELFELGIEGRNEHLIRGSTFLGCDVSYRGLVGGSRNLVGLEVGKSWAEQAVRRLSEYKHVGPADAATRQDLALLCVMFCEAARMIPHYDMVYEGWNVGSKIEEQHVECTRTWAEMSRDHEGFLWWRMSVLRLRLNSRLPRQLRQTRQLGRPLVEVLSAHAEDGVVGTITVFDGKRGQIIYKHCDGYLSQRRWVRRFSSDLKELALSGPYRAISADASFAIQVDGIPETDASGESSKASGDMVWDCYAGDDPYDDVSTRDIIIGTGRIVEVAYAVYRKAVEATVQVNLLLPAGINHVYGQITARYPLLDKETVLFSREPEEKVELVPSSAGSMVPLPLARSVIAVPLNGPAALPLLISVSLHAAPAESDEILLDGVICFDFNKYTGTIHSTNSDDIFLPVDRTLPDAVKGTGGHPEQGPSYSSDLQDTHGVISTLGSLQAIDQTSVHKCMVQVKVTSPGFKLTADH